MCGKKILTTLMLRALVLGAIVGLLAPAEAADPRPTRGRTSCNSTTPSERCWQHSTRLSREPERLALMLGRLRAHTAEVEREGPDWWRTQGWNGPRKPGKTAN
ncbi:MAG: hypothetical protein ACKOCX_11760 [Planctomycetota bacterium]